MSGPLVPNESSSSSVSRFNQTGTVNWVDLGSKTIGFALGALNRYSKAGIDVATVGISKIIFRPFIIPTERKKDLLHRIENLPRVAMYGRVAQFGFGLQHILADFAETDEGLTCVALCGCLTASYDSFYGAQVLRYLCICQNAPEDMVPGTKRWIALLKTCAGILAGTAFQTKVDGLQRQLRPLTNSGVPQLGATEPRALAEALIVLARVAAKDLESCVISGGIDCGWLGAVAEHVFDLSVSVMQTNGVVSYQSASGRRLQNGDCQITLRPGLDTESDTSVVRRSYHLPSGRDLFRESLTGFRGISQFEHRSQWTSILEDAFGTAAKDLLEQQPSKDFARLFVYAARRPSGNPFDSSDEKFKWPDVHYSPSGPCGDELLNFAIWRLPELRACLEAIDFQNIKVMSEDDARSHVRAISRACHCPACADKQVDARSFTCLIGVAGAIMHFVCVLSVAEFGDVLPTPFGIRNIYERSRAVNRRVVGAVPDWNFTWPLKMDNLVREVFELFSTAGSYPLIDGDYHTRLALASEGVCCFYNFLADVKLQPTTAARVQVIPGHIEYQGALFEKIEDMRLEEEEWSAFIWPIPRSFDLLLSETIDSNTLQVLYSSKEGQRGPACLFSIGRIVFWAGKPRTDPSSNCSDQITLPDFTSGDENTEDYYRESLWTCHLPEDGPINPCRGGGGSSARYSLIQVLSDDQQCNNLEIHKTSVRLWDNAQMSIEHLYAEYARAYRPTDRPSHFGIVKVSDCLGCVLAYVSKVWPKESGPDLPLPNDTIRGRLMVHTSQDSIEETAFELARIDTGVRALRTCDVEYVPKPFPTPKPISTASWILRMVHRGPAPI